MPSTPSQPRRHQGYTRDSDSKAFTVRSLDRPGRTVVLAATDGSGAFQVSFSTLRNSYTPS